MKIKMIYILPVIFLILLTGCQSYRELNDLAITTATSIDYNDETKEFDMIIQVVNTVKQQDASSSGEPAFVTFSDSAFSIQEAYRNIALKLPKKLYGAQMQIILLSENVINEHLNEVLDFFTRNPEIRSETKIIIAKNKETLQGITIQTLLDNLSSSNILSSLEVNITKNGIEEEVTLNDLTNMYLNPYLEIALPSIYTYGDIQESHTDDNKKDTVYEGGVKIGTSAIFKDNKLVYYLEEEESKYLSLVRGNTKSSIVKYDYKDGYIVFEPNNIKVETKANVKKNKVTINILGFAKGYEITSSSDIQENEETNNIEKFFNKKMEESILNIFNKIRDEYNTDVFKFRDLYYKEDAKYYKDNYDETWYETIFKDLKLEIKSNIKLYENGNTKEAIKFEKQNK